MTTNGFKKLTISDFNPSVDIEMVCRSYKLDIKRIEFPTKEKARISGETHFKAFKTGKRLLQYLLWEVRRDKKG